MPSVYDCAVICEDVYSAQTDRRATARGWQRTGPTCGSSDNGFFGAMYQKGDSCIVAFRGTEPTDLGDLAADAEMGPGSSQVPTGQTSAAMTFMDACINRAGERIKIVSGHSLGGALAKVASQRRDRLAIAFNAPYIGGLSGAVAMTSMLIRNYNANLDPVSRVTSAIGHIEEGQTTVVTVQPPSRWISAIGATGPGRALAVGAYTAYHYHSMENLREAIGNRRDLNREVEIPEGVAGET